MGPLVTARKIAPLTRITIESVLLTTGAAAQFLLSTQLITLDEITNYINSALELFYRHQHQN